MATTPREAEMLWPDPKTGPWLIRVWFRVQSGVPTPVGLLLRGWIEDNEARASGPHNNLPHGDWDVPLPAIDSKLLRTLPVGSILTDLRATLNAQLNREPAAHWPREWRESLDAWKTANAEEVSAFADKPRGGRDLGDEHYRRVAEIYASAAQRGEPPTKAVAEALVIAKSSAAKQVARARERGFLPPTSRGRVGPLSADA